MSEQWPDFVATMDQRQAEVQGLAKLLGTYFKALCQQRFERDEALTLVVEYQGELFETSRGRPPEE